MNIKQFILLISLSTFGSSSFAAACYYGGNVFFSTFAHSSTACAAACGTCTVNYSQFKQYGPWWAPNNTYFVWSNPGWPNAWTDPVTGQIYETEPDRPITCDTTNSIAVLGEFGATDSCITSVSSPEGLCSSVLGRKNNVDICGDHQDACFATGGTFGFMGEGENFEEICIANTATTPAPPTCSSGSYTTAIAGDGAGGLAGSGTTNNTLACSAPDEVAVNICDGTKYDCDGDGSVDDQNSNGLVDNGTADVGGAGTGSVAGEGTRNIGDSDFATAKEGVGQCDPTSTNYAECIGDGGVTGDLVSSTSTFSSINNTMSDRISASGFGGMASNIVGVFSGSGVCPAPEFSAFGTTFAINFHCTLYSTISGILSALMLVVFSIAGIRHMMSA